MRLGAVLMASGARRRFGGNKLLHPVDGVPMVERVFAAVPAELFIRACVVSCYPDILVLAGERGSPAVFPRDLFPELLALTGDREGGGVIQAHRDRLRLVEAYRSEELQDMDTPFDLEQPTGEEKKTCFEPIL